jgi:hypothetical protein
MNTSIPTSDIRIDEEGMWFYRGVEMSRTDIVKLFCRHLAQDISGCYFIEIGKQRYQVEVDDTAYVVQSVDWGDGGPETGECVYLLLSDSTIETLDPRTLRINKDNILYCRIRNRHFDARFSRSSYYRFAERLKHDPLKDAFFILLNGQRHYISHVQST